MKIKKRILFILPEISVIGGQELENIGFATFLNSDPEFEVEILNFYSPLEISGFENLPKVAWSPSQLKKVIFSKQFLKIYLKSGFEFNQSLANCFRNFPHLFDSWIYPILRNFDMCFAGISPRILLPHILSLCQKANLKFVYHESSIFNPKNHLFYKQMEKNGHFLISAKEKEDYLNNYYPDAEYSRIKQWIYLGQSDFLSISPSSSEIVRFGGIGRVDQGKNFKLILEALKILDNRGFKMKFNLYGDGPELKNLKKFTKASGLEHVVCFKGGYPFQKRASCFKEMDVFVMTSLFEGGPLVILEAIASGKPVITTKVGDVPNRVFDGVNGYVLPLECSALEVANQMQKYIDVRKEIIMHGRNSRELFLRDFRSGKAEVLFKETLMRVLDSKK